MLELGYLLTNPNLPHLRHAEECLSLFHINRSLTIDNSPDKRRCQVVKLVHELTVFPVKNLMRIDKI